jgi:hypothetical protein
MYRCVIFTEHLTSFHAEAHLARNREAMPTYRKMRIVSSRMYGSLNPCDLYKVILAICYESEYVDELPEPPGFSEYQVGKK